MSFPKGTNKKTEKRIKKLRFWLQKLQNYPLFRIRKNGVYGNREIMQIALSAVLYNRSIEYESYAEERPCSRDFYHHANNKLTDENIRKMFICHISEIIKLLKNFFHTSSFAIAIDKTDDPYWGEKENIYVTGGKREKSTNYAFRYLTAAIVAEGMKFIIYSRPLTKEDNNDALLVEECLKSIRKIGINISRVLLDREFYNGMIILVCNVADTEYVIPLKKDSKFERLLSELKNEGKKLPRVIENYNVADQLTNLVIYEDKNSKGETEIFGFITNIDADKVAKDVYAIADSYRERWAIENANKFQDAFNIHTNSTNGIVRYFFFVLTALLHNFWVLISLLAPIFSLCKISLNMFKDIAKAVFGFATAPHYKHAQLKLWVKLLVD